MMKFFSPMRHERLTLRARVFLLALGSAAILSGCQSAASPSAPPGEPAGSVAPASASRAQAGAKPEAWQQLVDDARREGTVTVYGPGGAQNRAAFIDAFEKSYSGIKVEARFADLNDHVASLSAERTAGKHVADIVAHGSGAIVTTLKDAGIIVPLKSSLMLPEVLDASLWLQNRLWWADGKEPLTDLQFDGFVTDAAFYNKKLVSNPAEFQSYWDFLDPKWKGKIVATDVRRSGPGAAVARFMLKNPKLGPPYFERLFSEMNIQLSSDRRQLIDWVSQGQYPLGLFLSNTDEFAAEAEGLPIGILRSEQFKEGATISSTGTVALVDQAPHPNAAKLYINWLLSKEGQSAYQQATKLPSLRTDLPKEGLLRPPQPNVDYANSSAEEYARLTTNEMAGVITAALEKAGR